MMKKRVLSILTLASALCACTGSAGLSDKDEINVILVTEGSSIDDKSFNSAAWRGITEYYGDTPQQTKLRDKYYKVINSATQDQIGPNIKLASDEAPDLVIGTGFTFAEAIGENAGTHPEQKYLIVDVDWINKPNVMEAIFAEQEGSFLVGAAAALQARAEGIEKPKFGFIGGIPSSTITKFEIGYAQGVRTVIPDAEIVDYYANDWGKPELGKSQAKNWFDNGVYCIFVAAGGTGNGAIAQAKEYRSQGKNVWAIGVDSDQYEDGLYGDKSAVLTSMVKKVETPVFEALTKVKEGTFTGGAIIYDLAKDGLDFSKANAELLPEVAAVVEEYKQEIINKEITVYATYKEALAARAVPDNLEAVDN